MISNSEMKLAIAVTYPSFIRWRYLTQLKTKVFKISDRRICLHKNSVLKIQSSENFEEQ